MTCRQDGVHGRWPEWVSLTLLDAAAPGRLHHSAARLSRRRSDGAARTSNAGRRRAQTLRCVNSPVSPPPSSPTPFPCSGGSFVFKSVDGGKTWATTHDAFEMLYLDITSFGDNVLAASIFGDEFSVDGGNNFNYSANGALQAQCVRNLGPHDTPLGFAAVGSVGNLTSEMNGVAISTDAGKTFTSIPLPLLQTDARYGAFPSDQVWYISAGA